MTPGEKLSIVKHDLNLKYIRLVNDVETLLNNPNITYKDLERKLNKKLNKITKVKSKFDILDEIIETEKNDNI